MAFSYQKRYYFYIIKLQLCVVFVPNSDTGLVSFPLIENTNTSDIKCMSIIQTHFHFRLTCSPRINYT